MNTKNTIIFTGGGSGGHVVPAISIINFIKIRRSYNFLFIGSEHGIERDLIAYYGWNYKSISTGKLRRYTSLKNIIDIFRFIKGIIDSLIILMDYKNNTSLVISMGGFVSVPVVIASKIKGISIFTHEQTIRAGLANRINSFFSSKVWVSFEESLKYFPKMKTFFSGYPLREEFNYNSSVICYDQVYLRDINKPFLLIIGGGNGSKLINDMIYKNFKQLTDKYFIVHQVGKIFIDEFIKLKNDSYRPICFISVGMIELYKRADIIISRAGAGTVHELLALNKRSIYIPLQIAQKNEQYFNAVKARNLLGSIILKEELLSSIDILDVLKRFQEDNEKRKQIEYKDGMEYILNDIDYIFCNN